MTTDDYETPGEGPEAAASEDGPRFDRRQYRLGRIRHRPSRFRARRFSRRNHTMNRGVGVLVMAAAVLLAGCRPAPESLAPSASTPQASSTPESRTSPTAPEPTPPVGILAPDATAQVVTTDLVMRSAPGGGPESEVFPGTLDAPTLLYVLDGPVTADGYDWYLVRPFLMEGNAAPPEHWRLGWVAASSRDGEAWIAPAAPECPFPDLPALMELSPVASLACFGDRELTLVGTFAWSDYIVPGVVSPWWLGIGFHMLRPPNTDPNQAVPGTYFGFHVADDDPSDGNQLDYEPGAAIRIAGHFDDPVAQTCVAGLLPGEPEPATAAEAELRAQAYILQCRHQFVATSVAPDGR
jgi:hypothetical protein